MLHWDLQSWLLPFDLFAVAVALQGLSLIFWSCSRSPNTMQHLSFSLLELIGEMLGAFLPVSGVAACQLPPPAHPPHLHPFLSCVLPLHPHHIPPGAAICFVIATAGLGVSHQPSQVTSDVAA